MAIEDISKLNQKLQEIQFSLDNATNQSQIDSAETAWNNYLNSLYQNNSSLAPSSMVDNELKLRLGQDSKKYFGNLSSDAVRRINTRTQNGVKVDNASGLRLDNKQELNTPDTNPNSVIMSSDNIYKTYTDKLKRQRNEAMGFGG